MVLICSTLYTGCRIHPSSFLEVSHGEVMSKVLGKPFLALARLLKTGRLTCQEDWDLSPLLILNLQIQLFLLWMDSERPIRHRFGGGGYGGGGNGSYDGGGYKGGDGVGY